jgi:hypothetical protein
MPEANWPASAWPWAGRSELPGSIPGHNLEQPPPVAELPGSQTLGSEPQTLQHGQEVNRQTGSSSRTLNSGEWRQLGIHSRF